MTFSEPLIHYAAAQNLIVREDACYYENLLLDLYRADSPAELTLPALPEYPTLPQLLRAYLSAAVSRGIVPADSPAAADRFTARLMGIFTPLPSAAALEFSIRGMQEPKQATDWFYHLCLANGYIRTDRTAQNIEWQTETEYGKLDITINLSKPEKDPKDIAAAAAAKSVDYPQCMLCRENEGYAGREGYPARQNLRMVPVTLADEKWYFQYSPYAYYSEHCIVLDERHVPMVIDRKCFTQLLEFVEQYPHYFVGSNADLPVVGGSILSHAHFQGGRDRFAMAEAPIESRIPITGYPDLECCIVHWPMSVLRLRGTDPARIVSFADAVLQAWRIYSDPERDLPAFTGETPHHTITPIARYRDDAYELDLVLRDNHTTPEHPLGVYHPHAELHHIKKENIGLIEVMGRAILPARLRDEMAAVRRWIENGCPETTDEAVRKHSAWVNSWLGSYSKDADLTAVLREEIGKVFLTVLEQCAVFPCTEDGRAGFMQFLASVPCPLTAETE